MTAQSSSRTSPPRRPRLLTLEQSRAVDRYAIEELGLPGIVLMENAGRGAADLIERWLLARARRQRRPPGPAALDSARGGVRGAPRVAIVCGKGNNGGDGFVVARHLAIRGYDVSIDLAADPAGLTGDAAVNHAITCNMGLPVRPLAGDGALSSAARRWRGCAVVVDALLGTGFTGELRDPLASIVARINALKGPLIVAIDVPSGLEAGTGRVGGLAVKADRTITMVSAKQGYAAASAKPYLGRVFVVDIGAPADLILRRLR